MSIPEIVLIKKKEVDRVVDTLGNENTVFPFPIVGGHILVFKMITEYML